MSCTKQLFDAFITRRENRYVSTRWKIRSGLKFCKGVYNIDRAYMPSTSRVWSFVWTNNLKIKPAATCIYLRYSVSYLKFVKFKRWQIITYEEYIMKFKIFFAINSEMRTYTRFKNTLTNYTKSGISIKRLGLVPVDWDKSGLIFTKRVHMMNKIVD